MTIIKTKIIRNIFVINSVTSSFYKNWYLVCVLWFDKKISENLDLFQTVLLRLNGLNEKVLIEVSRRL